MSLKRHIGFRIWNGEQMVDLVSVIMNYQPPAPDMFLMQYSEMKDIDGVKIFEGDFIEWYTNKMRFVRQVWFKDGSFRAIPSRGSSSTERNHLHSKKIYTAQMRVVGNVFKNPELLPKQAIKK
jgi:uncharacterized phage protein (TIGR01671 family)